MPACRRSSLILTDPFFSRGGPWLRQFIALGRESDADELALHVLMRSQGIATLAAAFRDETSIRREVEDMKDWVAAQIPSRKSR